MKAMDTNKKLQWGLGGDKVIWTIVFALSFISILLIYSSSSTLAFKEKTTNFAFLIKQVAFVAGGLGIAYGFSKIPLGVYRSLSYAAFWISVGLMVYTLLFGVELNGAKRWMRIGPLQFQTTEIIKITIPLYLARVLETCSLDTFKEYFRKILIPLGIAFALILLSSVSAALFVAILSFGILFIGGVKWSHIYKTAGIGGGLLLIVVILQLTANIILIPRLSTAIGRIEEFFQGDMTEQMKGMDVHEKQRLADETFQADMARVAVSSVGILGKGPGNSTQRYVLPHPYSDYVYAIIIEEYGLLGGATILMLYIWFLYRCVILVKNCSKLFSALTVVGIGLLISIQAVLHILVNVDIIPVTGHTLPLISYGGTSFLILCSAFGIILSVSRTIEITSKKIKKEENDTVENKVEEYEIIGPNNEFK